jgi:hypothetical protein
MADSTAMLSDQSSRIEVSPSASGIEYTTNENGDPRTANAIYNFDLDLDSKRARIAGSLMFSPVASARATQNAKKVYMRATPRKPGMRLDVSGAKVTPSTSSLLRSTLSSFVKIPSVDKVKTALAKL